VYTTNFFAVNDTHKDAVMWNLMTGHKDRWESIPDRGKEESKQ